MAITNAQQYQQLVNPPMKGNKRPGYRGSDMAGVAGDSRAANTGAKDTSGADYGGGNQGMDRSGPDDRGTAAQNRNQRNVVREGRIREAEKLIDRPNIFERINTFNTNFQRKKMLDLAKKRSLQKYQDIEQYADIMDDYGLSAEEIAEQVAANPSYGYDFSNLDKGLETLTSNRDTSIESTRPNLYDVNSTLKGRFAIGNILTDAIRPDTQVTALNTLNKARDYTGLVNTSSNMTNQELRDAMTDLQNRGKTDDQINPRDGDGLSDPCKGPNPPAYCFVGIRSAEAATPVEEEDEIINYRLMAGGGMADKTVGGIMDLESARQMYGLGKLVKKVTRSVKKIAKSPIGKAAIGAALFKFGSPFIKSDAFKNFMFKKGVPGFSTLTNKGLLAGIGGISALAGLMTPKEEEEESLYAGADIADPSYIMNNPGLFTNRRLAAEGGDIEKEPVAKKVMPLLDMGGQEMDLRAEGGFVPIGRMEKADDVPARLSKNEFVFTADAVRNAGDGSVDKGAEVMYNMMKNLESGGDVSEESQGLDGARKMFQTSQRLEEVL